MKILLTGIAGTGKSTLAKALSERGFAAMDLHDVPDLFFWQDTRTKEIIPYTPGRSKAWFATVDRVCNIEMLKEMLDRYDHDVIMAGSTSGNNQKKFFSLFDKIILLQCDPETIVHRMRTRTNKSGYGKSEAEQEDNVEWQKEYDPLLLSYGAIPVSTAGGLDETLERILLVLKGA